MTWPGEGLLIKLWETLADKGVGGLLKPWQIKREAKAQIEARRLEIVALADAEREAEEIRSGRRTIESSRYAIMLPAMQGSQTSLDQRIEPRLGVLPEVEFATASIIGDTIRREVNVAKAITHAESELKDDPHKAPERNVDSDWLFRWRDYAGGVSSEELQSLWGRLLAGEVKSPGSFSYRSLELLRNLTVDEARRIERLSRFVIEDFVARNQEDLLRSEGIHFKELLAMQELGILAGVEAIGLSRTFRSVEPARFVRALRCHGRVLLLRHEDPKTEVKLPVYQVTTTGRQILHLGRFSPHDAYLKAIGEHFKKSGIAVAIGNYRDVDEGRLEFFDAKEL